MDAIHSDLRRSAYLRTLGIDQYISRVQLRGAAPTRRLIVAPASANRASGGDTTHHEDAPLSAPLIAPSSAPSTAPADIARFREALDTDATFGEPQNKTATSAVATPGKTVHPAASAPEVRFTLSVITTGPWLWLEQLGDMPLATEQVALLRAMAHAMTMQSGEANAVLPAQPAIATFAWPMHNNRQLDNGVEAARASVTAYIGRLAFDSETRGIIALGGGVGDLLDSVELALPVVSLQSSRVLLAEPGVKPQAWSDLKALL